MQVYRGLDIGTAKPTLAERQDIPHHLIDIREPTEPYTAGDYARDAAHAIQAIAARGRLPIVAGGTGFYLRALLDGLSPGPKRDESLRARLMKANPGALHRLLRRMDPTAAARLHPNDTSKLIRAIEVCASGRTLTAMQGSPREPVIQTRAVRILLDPPRPLVHQRINARAEAMFREGLLEETRRLMERGVDADAPAFRAVGYKEARAVIEQTLSLAEAIARVQAATRQYAKRQWTWFRRESWDFRLEVLGTDAHAAGVVTAWLGEMQEKRGEIQPELRNISFGAPYP
jgi:tRNA dimethylallyltransferase